jgi:ABC-type transporter Mla subunit MlaD
VPPPPTIPPPTISTGSQAQIQGLIDQLSQFGDTFQDQINELRDALNS